MRLILLLGYLLILTGCSISQSTVYPYENDRYQVVTTSSDEAYSSQGAVDKAKSVCKEKQKELVVEKNETIYQGIDKNIHQALSIANEVSFNAGGQNIPTGSTSTDYKTTMIFKCK